MVCKLWEQLLRANSPAAREWVVRYNVDSIVKKLALTPQSTEFTVHEASVAIGRCVTLGTFVLRRLKG